MRGNYPGQADNSHPDDVSALYGAFPLLHHSSIYRFGKGKGERMQIQHIERLELELRQKQSQLDSVKQINDFNYEYDRETE